MGGAGFGPGGVATVLGLGVVWMMVAGSVVKLWPVGEVQCRNPPGRWVTVHPVSVFRA